MPLTLVVAIGSRDCRRVLASAVASHCHTFHTCASAQAVPVHVDRRRLPPPNHGTCPALPATSAGRFSRTTSRPASTASHIQEWASKTTPILFDLARECAARGDIGRTIALVDYLIRQREEPPNSRLFAPLILCNVDPEHGSPAAVRDYLKQLDEEGLPLDSGICHDVLKVLSIHVDHILRADILNYMRRTWFTLSTEGQHDVAAGLIREGSLEEALQIINNLQQSGECVPDWLGDMATYALLHAGSISGALDMVTNREASSEPGPSSNLGHTMLDVASKLHHYAGTLHGWNAQVRPGRANPSIGTLLEVLATAAQHGDTDLAVQAFCRLGQHAVTFSCREYELLCQAYLSKKPPDLIGALSTASTMAENGITPNQSFTRAFYSVFEHDSQQARQGFELMQELHRKGRKVSLALINTVLESCSTGRDLEQAMLIYQAMHEFEVYGPSDQPRVPFANATTYEILYHLAGQAGQQAHDLMVSLRDEQRALGVSTTPKMLEAMLTCCVSSGDMDHAKELLREAERSGIFPRPDSIEHFVDTLASRRDSFCWDLIRTYSPGGVATKAWEQRVLRVWTENG
ncbi:hypothetical protein KVT40_007878 [Elsinoe batatas]|uniref:Pentatricopeptide repeat-containing protein-mitochondrial domain-containing protein n=1 Tax=Elsinoe batatas TaxID=2601811 RepID=A0A8K0PCP6_9PEZI|nr:hypothetical protein KVT40_007878 [Elsinoe batatas]